MSNNIKEIISLLTIIANNQGITTMELCEKTQMPVEVIKSNLMLISENPEMYVVNLIYDDNDGDIKDFKDIRWFIDNVDDDCVFLCLNPMEKFLYESIVSWDKKYDEFSGILTKSNFGLEEYKYKLCQISLAVSSRKILRIKYRKDGETTEYLLKPLGIVFYEFENMLYVIGQQGENNIVTYRLDRIEKIIETEVFFKPRQDFNIDDYLSLVWGMEKGSPVKVKVRFENTGNILYKVKRDLHCRKNKKITEYGDYFIYEDTVIGIKSFSRWLRTYGSSAVVIEPDELRQEIINSAKQCLQYYL